MKRSGRLRRTAQLRTKKSLKRVSARELERRDRRRDVVMFVHARDRRCRAGESVPSVACGGPLDVHEILPRGRGGDELDPTNCLLVCRRHHDWIDHNPAHALELGLLRGGT